MKRGLTIRGLIIILLVAVGMGSSCNKQPPNNGAHQSPTPNAGRNDDGSGDGNKGNSAVEIESAMIFKVERDVRLKTKDAADFIPILYGFFRGGDLLRVGEQSIAWVTCSDKRVCPLGKGDYTECCRSACENGIPLDPPGQTPRVLMSKSELPPADLQAFENAEMRIRRLGASEVATQFLIANLYSSWKLVEANQEVDKLSLKLKEPDAQVRLDKLYLPMVNKTGDMYRRIDKKVLAEQNYKKVVELAPKAKDTEEEASARVSLGQIYSDSGRKKEAVETLEKSEQLYMKDGNAKKAAEVRRAVVRVKTQ